MTVDNNLPSRDELEALSESGFALAIQLLGRHEDAADVVQDALRKLIHSGQYDRRKGNPRVWFLKVVRNGALDALRLRRPNDDAPPSPIWPQPLRRRTSRSSGRSWPGSCAANSSRCRWPSGKLSCCATFMI